MSLLKKSPYPKTKEKKEPNFSFVQNRRFPMFLRQPDSFAMICGLEEVAMLGERVEVIRSFSEFGHFQSLLTATRGGVKRLSPFHRRYRLLWQSTMPLKQKLTALKGNADGTA